MANKRLSKFIISPAGDQFQLRIEIEGGEPIEATATYDQLDILADQLDDLLDAREAVQEVKQA